MEKTNLHYPHPAGVAAGLTAGIVYAVCAAVVTLWPTQALSFFANWFHGIDLVKIAVPIQITASSFVVGLIGVIISFYIVGFIYGWLYNICYIHCKKRKWI